MKMDRSSSDLQSGFTFPVEMELRIPTASEIGFKGIRMQRPATEQPQLCVGTTLFSGTPRAETILHPCWTEFKYSDLCLKTNDLF